MDSQASPALSTNQQTVSLAGRSHFNCVDEGLHGTAGAQAIISQLTTHRSAVTKLTLNHNPLGDDGVSLLFSYLSSTAGSRHPLSEISLNCAEVGCGGLQAISEYIRGNETLRTIWLASNALLPDPTVLSSLASAINDSRLRFLSLTNNNQLGDSFVEHFLPFLRSRHLHELHINAIGLTVQSAPAIGAWISGNNDGECHLQILKINGNTLGASGVWEIVRAIERGNWSMTKLEVLANHLTPSAGLNTETADPLGNPDRALHRVLMRNGYRKRLVETEALVLLRYSRSLLMHCKSTPTRASPSPRSQTSLFPFYALPNELKLYILGLLAPSLSSAQRMRVYNYASDRATLPYLLPPLCRKPGKLNSGDSDPSSLSVGFQVVSPNGGSQCSADGKWVGASYNSPLCRREGERSKFLAAMGCCTYEPERDGRNRNRIVNCI